MRSSNIRSHRLQNCFLNTKEQSIKTPLKNALREGYLKSLKATVGLSWGGGHFCSIKHIARQWHSSFFESHVVYFQGMFSLIRQ